MGNAGKASAKKRARGRPPLEPGRAKRSSFNTRIRSQLKEHLEREAKSAGRSLSEEIEHRLERSMLSDETRFDDFGGETPYRLCQAFTGIAKCTEAITGRSWAEDETTFAIAAHAWIMVLRTAMNPLTEDLKKFAKAMDMDLDEDIRNIGQDVGALIAKRIADRE